MEKMYHVKRGQVIDVASIDMDRKKALTFDFVSTDNFSWIKVPLSELVPLEYMCYFNNEEVEEENKHIEICNEAVSYNSKKGWYSPVNNQYYRTREQAFEAEMEIRGWR